MKNSKSFLGIYISTVVEVLAGATYLISNDPVTKCIDF